jgi:hypothetical protein
MSAYTVFRIDERGRYVVIANVDAAYGEQAILMALANEGRVDGEYHAIPDTEGARLVIRS